MQAITFKLSDIISKQATINIGTIGHVAHGKSTVVASLTGVRTQKHQEEMEKNLTIHLGYANAKLFQCQKTGEIFCVPSHITHKISPHTSEPMTLIKHISFVDCPGHASFMSTMISGTAVMDAIFLLISAIDPIFPQVQTYEHLLALKNTNINVKNMKVLQNKLDLVTKDRCMQNAKDIKDLIGEFLNKDVGEDNVIIPISAQLGINMDMVANHIAYGIDDEAHNSDKYNDRVRMFIIRSFDLNRPNVDFSKMKGGTVGGSIMSGTVFKDDYLEIRPGFVVKTPAGFVCQPIISKVVSLYSDKEELDQAFPGGLVSLSMDFDPSLSKQNHLVGNILGTPGTLPNIYHTITVIYSVLNKLNKYKSKKMIVGEKIMICVNAKSINATVSDVLEDKTITLELESPICLDIDQKIAILRQNVDKVIVLHSSATFVTGKEVSNIIYDHTTFNRIVAEIPKRQITIVNDIKKKTFDLQNMKYDALLNNIRFVKEVTDSNDTLQVIAPDVKSHNKRSIIINYNIILGSLDNSKAENNMDLVQNVIKEIESNQKEVINMSDFLSTFIEDELQTNVSVNQDKQLVIKGAYKNANLRNVISKFANKYKLCNNCNSYNTILTKQKNNRIISVKCMKCHADLSVL